MNDEKEKLVILGAGMAFIFMFFVWLAIKIMTL